MGTKLIWLLLLLMTFASCSPKKESSVPVKLKVFRSNLVGSNNLNGGVVIVGRSEDGLDSFRFSLADVSQDITLDLKKGRWEFAAIAWSGTEGLLTGVNRCSGTSMIDLKDAEASVSFNLTQARCLTPFSSSNMKFTDSSFQNAAGGFFSVRPVLCLSPVLTPANCAVGSNPTVFKSFKVLIPIEKKGNIIGSLPEMMTSCQNMDSPASMNFPVGDSNGSTPFGMKVQVYTNTTCAGEARVLDFSSGIKYSILNDSSKAIVADTTSQTSLIIMNPGIQASSNNVQINAGAIYTNNQNVSVSFSTLPPGVSEICFSNTSSPASCLPADWKSTLASPQAAVLSAGEGQKTIYIFTKNSSGLISLVGSDSIIADTTPPPSPGIGTYSNYSFNSVLNINWPAVVENPAVKYHVQYCDSAACNNNCQDIISYSAANSYSYTPSTDGSYIICVMAEDAAGNKSASIHQGTFNYDTIPPTVGSFNLNSGASYSNNMSMTYSSTASDATTMCFSNSSAGSACTPWVSYTSGGSHNFTSGQGPQNFYLHVKDQAGNIASTSRTIVIDTIAPTTAGAAIGLDAYYKASSFPVNFNWGASSDAGGIASYYYRLCSNSDCNSGCGTSVETSGSTPAASLVVGDIVGEGIQHICIKAKDVAQNYSSYAHVGQFVYDSIPPVIASFELNSNAQFTRNLNIPWTMSSSETPSQVCVQTSSSSTGCAWTGYSGGSGTFTLPSGDGAKTVYAFIKDAAGNISASANASIILDMTNPLSPNIDQIDDEVEGSTVSLAISGGSDVNFDKFKIDVCSDVNCMATVYGSAEFPNANGVKTVETNSAWALNADAYVSVKSYDRAGNFYGGSVTVKKVIKARAKNIAFGAAHICAALTNGKIKCWGANAQGQLGNGTATNVLGTSPVEMGDNLAIVNGSGAAGFYAKDVVANGDMSCALTSDGFVKCWGANINGSLGQGSSTPATTGIPLIVSTGIDAVIQLSLGTNHACFVTSKGDVKCWGENSYGQLGNGYVSANIGISSGQMGANLINVNLGSVSAKAIKVGAGNKFSCALLSDHTVKCWGKNNNGQLGQDLAAAQYGTNPSEMSTLNPVNLQGTAIDLSVGDEHSCALLITGNVKCWGRNNSGQLGISNTTNYGTASNPMSTIPTINLGTGKKAVAVHAGKESTCVVLDDGNTKCWGSNLYGILGIGSTTTQTIPPTASIDLGLNIKAKFIGSNAGNACAIIGDGNLKCWGAIGHGQGVNMALGGNPSEMGDNLKTVRLGTKNEMDAYKVVSGSSHSCALLYNGKVKCWGSNLVGQIGLNQTGGAKGQVPSDMGENLHALDLGDAVKDIYGSGFYGSSTCALMINGSLKCWGNNNEGQLGIGDINYPNDIVGDDPNEISSSLSVTMPAGIKVRSASLSANHTCAIAVDGLLYCFGKNSSGQLGIGNTTATSSTTTPVLSLGPVLQVATGDYHTCAITNNSLVKCWGEGSFGQLGYNNTNQHGQSSSDMSGLGSVLATSGAERIIKLSAGDSSTCALFDNRKVKCWGKNANGVLGQDSDSVIGDNNTVPLSATSTVNFSTTDGNTALDVQTNGQATCVLKPNAQVRCWGHNIQGLLGHNQSYTSLAGNSFPYISNIMDTVLSVDVDKINLGRNSCSVNAVGGVICWGSNSYGMAGQGTSQSGYGTPGIPVPTTRINL